MTAGWDWGSVPTIDFIAPRSALHGPLGFRICSINAGLLERLADYCRDPGRSLAPPAVPWTMDCLTDFPTVSDSVGFLPDA